VGGLGAAGLSAWGALTDPFTASADAVTAVAIALGGALAAWRWRATTTGGPVPRVPAPARRWWPWVAIAAAIVGFELATFLLGPRVDYPTLSSLYDSAARVRPVKGAFFAAWLALGVVLARW
jgi:hypothetical protein